MSSKVSAIRNSFAQGNAASNAAATPVVSSGKAGGLSGASVGAAATGPFLDREALNAIQVVTSNATMAAAMADQATVTRLLKLVVSLLSDKEDVFALVFLFVFADALL
jgi:hypothetical protein